MRTLNLLNFHRSIYLGIKFETFDPFMQRNGYCFLTTSKNFVES